MTTNVFDGAAGVVATDSRWSWQWDKYIVYLDDTGFEKIQVLDDLVVMFAGNGLLIQAWRDYLAAVPRILANQPAETKKVSVCMIDAQSGEFVRSAGGDYQVFDTSRFGGTGGAHALGCWIANRNAVRAVETAKGRDPSSGGDVKFVDIKGSISNVKALYPTRAVTIHMVIEAVHKRGLVMTMSAKNLHFGKPVPFELAAAQDKNVAAFEQQLASGQLAPSAPFTGMNREWTAAEKEGINDTLKKYGWK